MNCVICGQLIEEGRRQGAPPSEARYCSKCRAERRRRAKLKCTWRPEFDDILKAQYYGGLNHRFQVLNRITRMTGLPRWYIKRRAARLGLSMKMDRKPWTPAELTILEKLVGRLSSATIAKRLHRPESSVVNKLKRLGNSRRVREGYTMRDLEQCLGEGHHKISVWITNG
jgi:DNA-binding CsgD family transcriptional regulator